MDRSGDKGSTIVVIKYWIKTVSISHRIHVCYIC
jgi:hypothetical protein